MQKTKLIFIEIIILVSFLNISIPIQNTNLSQEKTNIIATNTKNLAFSDKKQKLDKLTYKTIKKQIQNRKKLQKSLQENYNLSFDNNTLKLLTLNSLQIEKLKNLIV